MTLTGDTHRTHHRSTPRDLIAKAKPVGLPSGDNVVASVLTLPDADLAGDRVIASGLSFAAHQRDPWIDLEHGLDPEVGRRPVGWATPTFGTQGGPYSVFKCTLPGGVESYVGCTHFNLDDTLQRQVCHLVKSGALPGVSLEFRPDWTVAKSLGRSPLEARDAYEFRKAEVVRWTHCVEPVCPGALTVLKSLPAELEPLAKVLRDGKVAGEQLHPVILKSLSRYKPTTKFIAVETKAMEPQGATLDTAQTAYDPDLPEDNAEPQAKPTAQAHYDVSNGILDAITRGEESLQSSEHVKGRKNLLAKMEKLKALAEDLKAMGDKIDAETGDEPEEAEGEEGDESEGDDEETDMETDSDGTLKAVRPVYKSRLAARPRFTLAQIQKGIADATGGNANTAPADPELAALEAKNAKLKSRLDRKLKIFPQTN